MNSTDEQVQVSLDGRLVMMPRSMAEQVGKTVKLTIDGRPVEVPRVSVSDDPKQVPVPRLTTIYDAALKAGVEIPTLCHREYMNPVAVCRVCCVEVEAAGGWRERVMAPACYRPVDDGIKVSTHHTSAARKLSCSRSSRASQIPCSASVSRGSASSASAK